MVEKYAASTGYALHCLGMWHSHLRDTGGSARDYKTASIINTKVPFPSSSTHQNPRLLSSHSRDLAASCAKLERPGIQSRQTPVQFPKAESNPASTC